MLSVSKIYTDVGDIFGSFLPHTNDVNSGRAISDVAEEGKTDKMRVKAVDGGPLIHPISFIEDGAHLPQSKPILKPKGWFHHDPRDSWLGPREWFGAKEQGPIEIDPKDETGYELVNALITKAGVVMVQDLDITEVIICCWSRWQGKNAYRVFELEGQRFFCGLPFICAE
jgi:hypothetical protein